MTNDRMTMLVSALTLTYPAIDPVLVQWGPLAVRWYSLAYIAGIVLGWAYIRCLNRLFTPPRLSAKALEDVVLYAVLGIICGGRLGYVLFYKPEYYAGHLSEILHVWEGGMSFHGGLLGVIIAFFLFARRYSLPFFAVTDLLACAAPIGLFFGRIANFINGELFGRASDVSWAMVFPYGGPLPRHPSQLYEAGLEGLILFLLLAIAARRPYLRERTGMLSGLFLLGYSLSRLLVEQFREPDDYLGFIAGSFTMGQLLSVPMVALGFYLCLRPVQKKAK